RRSDYTCMSLSVTRLNFRRRDKSTRSLLSKTRKPAEIYRFQQIVDVARCVFILAEAWTPACQSCPKRWLKRYRTDLSCDFIPNRFSGKEPASRRTEETTCVLEWSAWAGWAPTWRAGSCAAVTKSSSLI